MLNFYLGVFVECLFFPYYFFRNFILNNLSLFINRRKSHIPVLKQRKKVDDENLLQICIHEWGGYDIERYKTISDRSFLCGLKYQLERINNYKGKIKVSTSITISDVNLYSHLEKIKSHKIIKVNNMSMDFSGYAQFIQELPQENQFVLLMNSSISALQIDFIDDYLTYFKQHNDVGMLGISYSSKSYQTFVKNNFNPHIQSFFILTTSDVLREIIKLNNCFFPGSRSSYKLSIIKKGEIKLSKLTLKLGYKIAVVTEEGIPFDFYKDKWFDNGYGRWERQLGDCRILVKNINAINKLEI